MYNASHHHDYPPVEETGLIKRIVLLVIYLFLGSLVSLIAVTSVFASDGPDIDSARVDDRLKNSQLCCRHENAAETNIALREK